MTVLIVVVLVTIFISAQCSLYEATLYSTRRAALEAPSVKKQWGGLTQRMLQMKKDIAVPIAAILILNTFANTAGATLAGMYADMELGAAKVPLFSVGLTLAILFLAEILPKTLGAMYWPVLWPFIVWPLTVMRFVLYPVIRVTQKFTDLLTGGRMPAPVTEEEILGTVLLGAKEGEISQWESRVVHNIIKLEERTARDIMTPRTVMFTLEARLRVEQAFRAAAEQGFTRIPVYQDDKEKIIGYVMLHDLSSAKALGQSEAPLDSMIRPIPFVAEDTNCLSLLSSFLGMRRHIAVVRETRGGVAGLVTLEDLLETALGEEIVDETDRAVDWQKVAKVRRKKILED